ncbi:hypothetical protein [uncultured Roseobacter sp.]|nr:hypothetical protein [uncultured Roseobacter sp.]
MRLQLEHPAFGMSAMRTITRRLIENARSDRRGHASGAATRSAGA